MNFLYRIYKLLYNQIGRHLLLGHFPYAYARFYYWKRTNRKINYRCPKNINEKLFWLARYWQHPLIVQCADKLAVRDYVQQCGCSQLLTKIYYIWDNAHNIEIDKLQDRFVLKCNHCGGGKNMIICKDKSKINIDDVRNKADIWLKTTMGIDTAEYHYQYIKPKVYVEEYIGDNNDNRLEIQVFCFNGQPDSILVRNDLGDKADSSFAISYDLSWKRVNYRKNEDMSVDIPKPKRLNEIIQYAKILAQPFPMARVDFYYVDNKIIFGELTFTTSGNVLSNYTEDVINEWGKKLVLPKKLKTKWSKVYKSYKND